MGLLDFIGKQFIDVIQWTEPEEGILAYRYPMRDMEIQNGAVLTVRESQMAAFVNEGRMADVFAPGRHTLTFWSVDAAGNVEAPTTASFAIQEVKTRAALSKPAAPLSVRRRAGFTVSGAVSPAHAVGTSLVTLRFYRYESGHYVLRKTVAAKAASSAAGRSTYAVRTSLSSRGKWRVRAVHADASHLTSYSSYRYIIVK
jgi:hypothetical protein